MHAGCMQSCQRWLHIHPDDEGWLWCIRNPHQIQSRLELNFDFISQYRVTLGWPKLQEVQKSPLPGHFPIHFDILDWKMQKFLKKVVVLSLLKTHRASPYAFWVGQKNWVYWLKMVRVLCGARVCSWFWSFPIFSDRNSASKLEKIEFCVVILANFEKVLLQPFSTTKFLVYPLLNTYFH